VCVALQVLQLDIDATVEDVKFRYKKLSLLIHPDKNHGNIHAQEAFDYVKKAQEELLDDATRQKTIDIIDATRAETGREHRKLIRKGLKERDLEPLELKTEKNVMIAFAGLPKEKTAQLCVS
jgi:DnaJ family protein C protein 8